MCTFMCTCACACIDVDVDVGGNVLHGTFVSSEDIGVHACWLELFGHTHSSMYVVHTCSQNTVHDFGSYCACLLNAML